MMLLPAECSASDPANVGPSGRRRPGRSRIKSPKAADAGACRRLEQLPNVGPSLACDLRSIDITQPDDLRGQDAYRLYRRLCETSGQRQDPCVLDTFLAAIDFMNGAPAAPWWHYTAMRKAQFGNL